LLKKSEKKQIREFSEYIPSLSQYKGKEKITSQQYAAFKRAKKHLRHTENLKPLTEAQAKKLGKRKLAGHGMRAIRLRNTSPHAKVRVTNKGVLVTSNGREWEYHSVPKNPASDMAERMIEKGRDLFSRTKKPPFQLHIWTSKGRSNEGAASLQKWAGLIMAFFQAYQASQDFIEGVAAMVTDVGGKTRKPLRKKDLAYDADEIEDEEEE
jgi:hypothetical protein